MSRDQWLLNQLPVGMLGDDFFTRFVSIFQAEAGTLTAHADNLPHLADPTLTPPAMLRWLATWIGTTSIDPDLPEETQRRLVTTASRTLARRGTLGSLEVVLGLFSGGPAFVEDGGGVWGEGEAPPDHAWVVMRVESTGTLSDADFVTLVADHIPAHVRAELWVGDRQIWPQPTVGVRHD
ncbi:phage tail protein [Actinotalea sp. M2MS4P-6]|uniref:phage tail protein n=1 Tax=Actinotalea sp. M2MS4P-6 TaxID=2983762 RepID=UPI0021E3C1E8|nr:phage tail protein [Actinotalea sp. M2MS4P-6]MCV2395219.1 phage tail protein [Actinotalea sp. M2MS4P-6]